MDMFSFMDVQREAIRALEAIEPKKRDKNKKIRVILLACQLLAAKLGLQGTKTALRIKEEVLAEGYQEADSISKAGATKMAKRDLALVRDVFGLDGSTELGFQMAMSFEPPEAYLQMFKHWQTWIREQSTSKDTVLAVMVDALIKAIDSAFTLDPICMPKLAQDLKVKYGKSNIRDTKKPLNQLFHDRAMANYLPLEAMVSETPDTYKVDTRHDPLLLNKRGRDEVGENTDDTLVVARPGLIRSRIYALLKTQTEDASNKLLRIAEAVHKMEIWSHADGQLYVPYVLQWQAASNCFNLVLCRLDDYTYQDIDVKQIADLPAGQGAVFRPDGFDEELWKQWKSLSYWRV
ncbi:MAG: hypothetical protein R8M38_03185 [Mariprofundaceae bacterium]